MHRSLVASLFVVLAAVAADAGAQVRDNLYVGGAAGPSKIEYTDNSIAINGATATTLTKDDTSSTAFKIYAGYRINNGFAVEAGLASLGKFQATRRLSAPSSGSVRSEITVTGVYFDAVGIVPLGSVEPYGKLGFIATGTAADRTATGSVFTTGNEDGSESEVNLHAGVGIEVRMTQQLRLRLEYERAFKVGKASTTGEGDISTLFVGVTYRY